MEVGRYEHRTSSAGDSGKYWKYRAHLRRDRDSAPFDRTAGIPADREGAPQGGYGLLGTARRAPVYEF